MSVSPKPKAKMVRAEDEPHMRLARQLAHNDKEVRNKATKKMKRWFKFREEITAADMRKVWKGLFYCMWRSDKVPVQQELCGRLSGLTFLMEPDRAMLYHAVFFETMIREWTGIDALRMNKFMSLVRFFVRDAIKFLAQHDFDEELVAFYAMVLSEGPVQVNEQTVRGILTHTLDLFGQELLSAHQGKALSEAALVSLLQPFLVLVRSSSERKIAARAIQGIIDPLLASLEPNQDGKVSDALQFAPCCDVLSKICFELASAKETRAVARADLYALRRRFTHQHTLFQARQPQPEPEPEPLSDDNDKPSEVQLQSKKRKKASKAAKAQAHQQKSSKKKTAGVGSKKKKKAKRARTTTSS